MADLTHFFFRDSYPARTTLSVIAWWEERRLAYNAAVGAAGLASLATIALTNLLPPLSRPAAIPWAGVLIYGILANVFYSLGPVVDACICRTWGDRYAPIGATLFRYGFAFSVGLTLLPVPMSLLTWGLRLIGLHF